MLASAAPCPALCGANLCTSKGYPPVKRSSMLLATSSQTAAKSSSSCLPKTFSVVSASCRYITPRAEGNHPTPCLSLCGTSHYGPGRQGRVRPQIRRQQLYYC